MRIMTVILPAGLLIAASALPAQRPGYDKGGLFEGLMADHAGAGDADGARRVGGRMGGDGHISIAGARSPNTAGVAATGARHIQHSLADLVAAATPRADAAPAPQP